MTPPLDPDRIAEAVRALLGEIDPDPGRADLAATPARVAEAWRRFASGHAVDVDALLEAGAMDATDDGLVLVRDITFYSVCEHHLVPFFGRCHVGYVPGERIVGLSKIARLVDAFARRLQVQERMTAQIADALERVLRPAGVMVVAEAQHLCMMMRGCDQDTAVVTTRAARGVFTARADLVGEFLERIR